MSKKLNTEEIKVSQHRFCMKKINKLSHHKTKMSHILFCLSLFEIFQVNDLGLIQDSSISLKPQRFQFVVQPQCRL